MITSQEITLFIYNLTLFPITFFSVLFLLLTLFNLFFVRKNPLPKKRMDRLPFVSVQIPTFNDPIAERCIMKCMEFDYPRSLYEIVIADDSTNPSTQKILQRYAEENPGFIKYIHRDSREGFKAGALKNAMKITRGKIFVIFDSDWMPARDFLKKIVTPFVDPKVAIVQARQGFYNKDTNFITRFAAYTLMMYHTIILPLNNRINCVFFCGTAGAIRREAFESVGGWNLNSINEDSDLSVRLLTKGYNTVYLDFATPSEVPDTFEGFLKQQMRWCYGNVRVFIDHQMDILFRKGLTLKQRVMITYLTLANVGMPLVVIMTLSGFAGWFLGEPSLFDFGDVLTLLLRLVYTVGFLFMGIITLHKQKILDETHYLVLSSFTIGLVVAVANSIALAQAVFNRRLHWFCTPKTANAEVSLE